MAAKENNNNEWKTRANWPHSGEEYLTGSVWNANPLEFVIGRKGRLGRHAFCKYNVESDTWTPILTGLLDKINVNDIEIDWKMKRMFLWSQINGKDKLSIIDIQRGSKLVQPNRMPAQSKMISLNGSMHCLGYSETGTTHHIWSEAKQRWHHIWGKAKQRWQPMNAESLPEVRRIDSLIHVPSKNILLMFASYDPYGECLLWRYHIRSNRWELISGIQLEDNCPMILTSDERFVIIRSNVYYKTHPLILDIRNDDHYKLRESPVVLHYIGFGVFARTGGIKESVATASGWIRRLRKSGEIVSISIPLEIVKTIARWYSEESIHWIHKQAGQKSNHQMIALQDILALSL